MEKNTHPNLHISPLKCITFSFIWYFWGWWWCITTLSTKTILKISLTRPYKHVCRPFWITRKNFNDSRNRLTLFGNATLHCKTGIFLWGTIHQTSGLDVAQGGHRLMWPGSDLHSPLGLQAADRSDVYSGSVKGRFLLELFTIKPLHPTARIYFPYIQRKINLT